MYKLLRVSGNSMLPTIKPRDILLIREGSSISSGDLVVVSLQAIGLIVKRVKQVDLETIELVGDNPRLGSSTCGPAIDKRFILGRVIASLSKPFSLTLFLKER